MLFMLNFMPNFGKISTFAASKKDTYSYFALSDFGLKFLVLLKIPFLSYSKN
jgi:hypothetical protein